MVRRHHLPQGGPLEIPLAFLAPGKKYTATIYSDRNPDQPKSKEVRIETLTVDSSTVLHAICRPTAARRSASCPRQRLARTPRRSSSADRRPEL